MARLSIDRGDSRDFNRAVADAQLRFAEDQVFQPERDEFDFVINRKVLADIPATRVLILGEARRRDVG